jgi:hypothetical protein
MIREVKQFRTDLINKILQGGEKQKGTGKRLF